MLLQRLLRAWPRLDVCRAPRLRVAPGFAGVTAGNVLAGSMKRSVHLPECIDLCSDSPSPVDPVERTRKRLRGVANTGAGPSLQADEVVDLNSSGKGSGAAALLDDRGGAGGFGSSWNELTAGFSEPSRWRSVRRRSSSGNSHTATRNRAAAGRNDEASGTVAVGAVGDRRQQLQQQRGAAVDSTGPSSSAPEPGFPSASLLAQAWAPPPVHGGANLLAASLGGLDPRAAALGAGALAPAASARVNRRAHNEPHRSLHPGSSAAGHDVARSSSAARRQQHQQLTAATGNVTEGSALSDEQIARRLQREEEARATRTHAPDDAQLRRRMEQLEQLEEAYDALNAVISSRGWRSAVPGYPNAPGGGSAAPGLAAAHTARRSGFLHPGPAIYPGAGGAAPAAAPPAGGLRRGRGAPQHERWGANRLADAMMSLFAHGMPFAGPGPAGAQRVASHHALGNATAGAGSGRVPLHLLFTDRDFGADDYEMLLALDEGVENRKGASTNEIEQLPTEVASVPGNSDDVRCTICLEDIETGSVLRRLHCKHRFHQHCIDKWLQHKAACPICQQSCKGGHGSGSTGEAHP